MDEAVRNEKAPDGRPCIWLHYRTQFTVQERLHVMQVEVPVPVGASPETRARLIQEAVEGLDQLTARVEQRVAQLLGTSSAESDPAPTGSKSAAERSATAEALPAGHLAGYPAARSISRPAARPVSPSASTVAGAEPAAPPRRRVGPSMPSTPGVFGNINSDLTLPQFLQILRDNFNLDSKQAMRLLGVRTLSNINLREALDQLRYLIGQEGRQPAQSINPALPADPRREWSAYRPREREDILIEEEEEEGEPTPGEGLSAELEGDAGLEEEQVGDWEEEGERLEAAEAEEDAEEEREEPPVARPARRRELSIQERVHARTLLNKLRDVRGSSPASQARINVLWNVIATQISEDQLQELIRMVWGVATLKQLTIDQVEALISWAKQDDFESEVEAVLSLG